MKKHETVVVATLLAMAALCAAWPIASACWWVLLNVPPAWICVILSGAFLASAVGYIVIPEWRRLAKIEAAKTQKELVSALEQMQAKAPGGDWPDENDVPSEGGGPLG